MMMADEPSAVKGEDRRSRLAKALRANLKRRKTQARSRAETDSASVEDRQEDAHAQSGAEDRDR